MADPNSAAFCDGLVNGVLNQLQTSGLIFSVAALHKVPIGKRARFLLALVDTSVAIAQTAGSRNPSAPPPSTNPDKPGEAPVGHRQPRADQVPSEKNLMGDPNDPINRENAALDRMVKGICRGC